MKSLLSPIGYSIFIFAAIPVLGILWWRLKWNWRRFLAGVLLTTEIALAFMLWETMYQFIPLPESLHSGGRLGHWLNTWYLGYASEYFRYFILSFYTAIPLFYLLWRRRIIPVVFLVSAMIVGYLGQHAISSYKLRYGIQAYLLAMFLTAVYAILEYFIFNRRKQPPPPTEIGNIVVETDTPLPLEPEPSSVTVEKPISWGWFPKQLEVVLIAFILLMGAFFRIYMIDDIPPGLYYDEAKVANDFSRRLDDLTWKKFFQELPIYPVTHWYAVGYCVEAFGRSTISVRLPSIISGILTLLFMYFLVRRLLGVPMALLSVLFITVSHWHITFSRIAFSGIQTPMYACIILFLVVKAWEDSWFYWLPAVFILVLGFNSYHPSRLILFIGVFYSIHRLFLGGRFRLMRYRWVKITLIAILGLGILTFIVFAVLAWHNLTQAMNRGLAEEAAYEEVLKKVFFLSDDIIDIFKRRSIFRGRTIPEYPEVLKKNFLAYMGMYSWKGDRNSRHNLGDTPMVHQWLAPWVFIGFVYMLFRILQSRYFLWVMWYALMLAPALLAEEAPHALRSIGTIIPVFVFAALPLGKVGQDVYRIIGRRWYLGTVGVTVFACFVGFLGYQITAKNYEIYFVKLPTDFTVWEAFDTYWIDLGEFYQSVKTITQNDFEFFLPASYTGNIPAFEYMTAMEVRDRPRYDPQKNVPYIKEEPESLVVYALDKNSDVDLERLQQFYPNGILKKLLSPRKNVISFVLFIVPREQILALYGLEKQVIINGQIVGRESDRELNFTHIPANPADNIDCIVAWSGLVHLPKTGRYEFTIQSDGPWRMYLDGDLLLDHTPRADLNSSLTSASIRLGEGQLPIRLECPAGSQVTTCMFRWRKPDETAFEQIKPHNLLNRQTIQPEFKAKKFTRNKLTLRTVASWKVNCGDCVFKPIKSMDCDIEGNLYVLTQNRVYIYTPDDKLVRDWTREGYGRGFFRDADGIAVGPPESIYIYDEHGTGLCEFSPEGEFLKYLPHNMGDQIDCDREGFVYGAHSIGVRKIKGDKATWPIYWSRTEPPLKVSELRGIKVMEDGQMYILEKINSRVIITRPPGNERHFISVPNVNSTTNFEVDTRGTMFVVTHTAQPKFSVIADNGDFQTVSLFEQDGSPVNFRFPRGIAISPDSKYLYIGDTQGNLVRKFEMTYSDE